MKNLTTISFKDFNSQKKNKFFMEELKVMSFSPTKGILCDSEDWVLFVSHIIKQATTSVCQIYCIYIPYSLAILWHF